VENVRLLVWMNRLSDYLWLLARLEEGRPEMLRDG
jgi:cob(I)alamin adenosyltransferase